jgi:hypothetical protein
MQPKKREKSMFFNLFYMWWMVEENSKNDTRYDKKGHKKRVKSFDFTLKI